MRFVLERLEEGLDVGRDGRRFNFLGDEGFLDGERLIFLLPLEPGFLPDFLI